MSHSNFWSSGDFSLQQVLDGSRKQINRLNSGLNRLYIHCVILCHPYAFSDSVWPVMSRVHVLHQFPSDPIMSFLSYSVD